MSCYIRHLKDIFADAGVKVTRENRGRIDRTVHEAQSLGEKTVRLSGRS